MGRHPDDGDDAAVSLGNRRPRDGTGHPNLVFYEQPGPRPTELQYWPLGTLCYGLAVLWAGARTLGWNADGRVTAGLVGLVGVTAVVMSAGFGVDPNRTAYPVAAVHALGVAAWLWIGQSHLRRALEN
ncbi:hypothetical protein [Natronosalvus vescus]|uniref:hypothetical protein n=1 Tax=Natronosalvus vescus TaxID=2953881 RepID=UPI0020905A51|nr:hypothetical protein [Natronosalvus vescus]